MFDRGALRAPCALSAQTRFGSEGVESLVAEPEQGSRPIQHSPRRRYRRLAGFAWLLDLGCRVSGQL
ncbi:MAG: hypothetical protein JO304_26895 [Solirubrobacterales bacterium]|nr:hypothetical protein [Solirubrobacterales bacterium]